MGKSIFIIEPEKQEIVRTHIFDARRELVFKVYTNPESIPQWWGPKRLTTKVNQMEVRPGGRWHFVQTDEDGKEYAFHGVYHGISKPEWVISTFEYEGTPGHVILETVVFEEMNGKTRMTDSSVFQSVEDRDAMVLEGMEEGSSESMERLSDLIAKVIKGRE
jgi:uncharacterized protein YndB with AHSA1/START domain